MVTLYESLISKYKISWATVKKIQWAVTRTVRSGPFAEYPWCFWDRESLLFYSNYHDEKKQKINVNVKIFSFLSISRIILILYFWKEIKTSFFCCCCWLLHFEHCLKRISYFNTFVHYFFLSPPQKHLEYLEISSEFFRKLLFHANIKPNAKEIERERI